MGRELGKEGLLRRGGGFGLFFFIVDVSVQRGSEAERLASSLPGRAGGLTESLPVYFPRRRSLAALFSFVKSGKPKQHVLCALWHHLF